MKYAVWCVYPHQDKETQVDGWAGVPALVGDRCIASTWVRKKDRGLFDKETADRIANYAANRFQYLNSGIEPVRDGCTKYVIKDKDGEYLTRVEICSYKGTVESDSVYGDRKDALRFDTLDEVHAVRVLSGWARKGRIYRVTK